MHAGEDEKASLSNPLLTEHEDNGTDPRDCLNTFPCTRPTGSLSCVQVPSLKTSSSTETMKHVPIHPMRVQFAASPYLQTTHQFSDYRAPTFQNPFSEQLEAQSRRTSTTSQDSDDFLLTTFAKHRDTLARLGHNVLEGELADEEDGRGSCEYTPTQASLATSRRSNCLLRQHRDTLARLHFRQNCDKALPVSVLEVIASLVDQKDFLNMRLTCRRWADHFPLPLPAESIPSASTQD